MEQRENPLNFEDGMAKMIRRRTKAPFFTIANLFPHHMSGLICSFAFLPSNH